MSSYDQALCDVITKSKGVDVGLFRSTDTADFEECLMGIKIIF